MLGPTFTAVTLWLGLFVIRCFNVRLNLPYACNVRVCMSIY